VTTLTDLEDLYPRLVDALLPTTSRRCENSAGFGKPDPRRAPLRIEVHDLLDHFETDVREMAAAMCDALGSIRCLAHPIDSDAGRPMYDPRVRAALATLRHHWTDFEERMPEMAAEVDARLRRLATRARRLVGLTRPPVPLLAACPNCGQPTIFRLETEDGWVAVCVNPADVDVYGARRRWSEIEWEDAHDPRFASSAASG
jgi:hypothetical protein